MVLRKVAVVDRWIKLSKYMYIIWYYNYGVRAWMKKYKYVYYSTAKYTHC